MRVVVLDFETFWNSKNYTLNKVGPIQYIRDPLFHAQLLGYVELPGNGPVRVVEAGAIADTLASLRLEAPDTITVAHNGNGFDFLILSERYGIRPYCMVDPICMMRWCGLARLMPCSHAKLTEALGHGVKTAGTVISDGKQWPQDFTPEEQAAFKRYCADDVQQCALNFSWLFQYCTPKAMQFMSLTAKMATNPMLLLDTALIDEYLRDLDAATEKARESIGRLFHFDTQEDFLKAIRSKSSFVQMLRTFGVEPPMKYSKAKSLTMKAKMEAEGQDTSDPDSYAIYEPALAKTDLEFTAMQEHPDPRVALLVNTRLEQNSSAARSRAVRLRELAGEPLPVMLSAFLAHTSRYTAGQSESASDSINLQNMGKRQAHLKKLRRAIKVPQGYKLVAVDSGQIEARVLAYEAQETELLHHFATGGDPYAEQAEKFGYGPSAQEIHDGAKSGDAWLKTLRNVGKTCVLSCLAADTEVLTSTGWKPIITVSSTDKLWDGEQWVTHQGLTCNGRRETTCVDGVRMTPDHLIWNGSSWNTASECVQTHSYLSRALRTGAASLKTLRSMKKADCSTYAGATNAETAAGFLGTTFHECQRVAAGIAQSAVVGISSIFASVIQIIRRVLALESLRLYNPSDAMCTEGTVSNGWSLCNAHAVRSHTGFCSATCTAVKRHVATSVQRSGHLVSISRSILPTPMSAQTPNTVGVCSIELPPVYRDAQTQTARRTSTTVREESSAYSHLGATISYTLCRLKDGITRTLTLTVLTTAGTMNRAISGLRQKAKTRKTVGKYTKCNKNSTNFENVYDLLNAGPRNRFTIRTLSGALVVHNCGYGVSAKKFSDTLLRQDIKLNEDLDKHYELAMSAHQIYRASNPHIKAFWRTCDGVLKALLLGGSGAFGGPDGSLFRYGTDQILGRNVPSVWLPTGFALRYPNLRTEMNDAGRMEYRYDQFRGRGVVPTHIYGASLTENLTQALAFQILMEQACAIDAAGIPITVNVHDCWAAVVPEHDAERVAAVMSSIMASAPAWAQGLPLSAEAEIGDDYTVA